MFRLGETAAREAGWTKPGKRGSPDAGKKARRATISHHDEEWPASRREGKWPPKRQIFDERNNCYREEPEEQYDGPVAKVAVTKIFLFSNYDRVK